MAVLLELPVGQVVVDLFVEEEGLCRNFLGLCAKRYYDGCLFYNVQPRCIAQTGDPTGTGRGGEAADGNFIKGKATRKHDKVGLLSMAAMGDGVFGSQFFITLRGDDLEHLDNHCIIGQVAEGFEALEKLSGLYVDSENRPWQDVRILQTHILDDPYDHHIATTPPPSRETIPRRVAYGHLDDDDDIPDAERERVEAEKKAKSQAQVLEMIGDLPHADVQVPRNELFVCKLNKVTEDADLEIIFSRFGKISSCDVVRDWKTGDSLNFAFISFDDEASCVEAYKKMNGVLIDDSRIKVDFSQSVAKLWSRYTLQYKGKLRSLNNNPTLPSTTPMGEPISTSTYGGGSPSPRGAASSSSSFPRRPPPRPEPSASNNRRSRSRSRSRYDDDDVRRSSTKRGSHRDDDRSSRRRYDDDDRSSRRRYDDDHRSSHRRRRDDDDYSQRHRRRDRRD